MPLELFNLCKRHTILWILLSFSPLVNLPELFGGLPMLASYEDWFLVSQLTPAIESFFSWQWNAKQKIARKKRPGQLLLHSCLPGAEALRAEGATAVELADGVCTELLTHGIINPGNQETCRASLRELFQAYLDREALYDSYNEGVASALEEASEKGWLI